MNTKSAPSQHLRLRHVDFRQRYLILLAKINRLEVEDRISKAKADELRGMLK